MPFNAGAIVGTISLNTSAATQAAKEYSSKLGAMLGSASEAIRKHQAEVRTVGLAFTAIGGAGILLGKQLVSASGQMERYRAQFTVLMGSADAARVRLEKLTNFAAKTPFDLPGVIEADRMLKAFNIDLGGMDKTLTIVGDAAAGMGVSITEVVPILAKLKAGMFEVEQMARLGITRESLAKFGIEFTKAGEVVNREDLFPAAIKLLSRFQGTMDATSKTLEGRMSNLRDAIFQVSAALGDALLPLVKTYADRITDALNATKKWSESHQEAAGFVALTGAKLTVATAALGGFIWLLPQAIAGLRALKGVMAGPSGAVLKGVGAIGLILAAADAANEATKAWMKWIDAQNEANRIKVSGSVTSTLPALGAMNQSKAYFDYARSALRDFEKEMGLFWATGAEKAERLKKLTKEQQIEYKNLQSQVDAARIAVGKYQDALVKERRDRQSRGTLLDALADQKKFDAAAKKIAADRIEWEQKITLAATETQRKAIEGQYAAWLRPLIQMYQDAPMKGARALAVDLKKELDSLDKAVAKGVKTQFQMSEARGKELQLVLEQREAEGDIAKRRAAQAAWLEWEGKFYLKYRNSRKEDERQAALQSRVEATKLRNAMAKTAPGLNLAEREAYYQELMKSSVVSYREVAEAVDNYKAALVGLGETEKKRLETAADQALTDYGGDIFKRYQTLVEGEAEFEARVRGDQAAASIAGLEIELDQKLALIQDNTDAAISFYRLDADAQVRMQAEAAEKKLHLTQLYQSLENNLRREADAKQLAEDLGAVLSFWETRFKTGHASVEEYAAAINEVAAATDDWKQKQELLLQVQQVWASAVETYLAEMKEQWKELNVPLEEQLAYLQWLQAAYAAWGDEGVLAAQRVGSAVKETKAEIEQQIIPIRTMKEVWADAIDATKSAWQQFFEDIGNGIINFGNLIKSVFQSIVSSLASELATLVTGWIKTQLGMMAGNLAAKAATASVVDTATAEITGVVVAGSAAKASIGGMMKSAMGQIALALAAAYVVGEIINGLFGGPEPKIPRGPETYGTLVQDVRPPSYERVPDVGLILASGASSRSGVGAASGGIGGSARPTTINIESGAIQLSVDNLSDAGIQRLAGRLWDELDNVIGRSDGRLSLAQGVA